MIRNRIQETMEGALKRGMTVNLYLDARIEECRVHEVDASKPWRYALRFVPNGDHKIDERGIESVLVFKGMPRRVYVPWRAVYGLQVGKEQPIVWDYAAPFEILGHPPINIFPQQRVIA